MTTFADVIRTVDLIAAILAFFICLRVATDRSYHDRAQLYRFLGLAALCLSVSVGAYHALGHTPYWPVLVANTIGIALSLRGTVPMTNWRRDI